MSQINVNTITGKDGGSAVNFPNGITVTGVITATQLTQNVTGDITASGTVTGGAFSGPLTGNVTGNTSGTAGSTGVLSAGATGADLTLSGNLTVNGTTTTIDTAVTAVDSLAVDGAVSVGVTNASDYGGAVKVAVANTTGSTGLSIISSASGDGNLYFADGTTGDSTYRGYVRYNHTLDQFRIGTSGIERLRIDGNGTTKFKGPLTEKCNRDTGAGLTGDYNHDLISYGNVHWSTSNSSGTWTYNIRGSSTVALNDMMADGETLSFQLISAQNSTSNYMTAFKIDGSSSHLVFWQGGSAPSEGGSSGYDVYTFTVFKIGNASFRTFASLTNHA